MAELPRGTMGEETAWREWCRGVLGGMTDLMARVQAAASEAGRLEDDASPLVSLWGTDEGKYWDPAVGDEGMREWLLARRDVHHATKARMGAIVRLRTARLTRLAAVRLLAGDPGEAAEGILADVLGAGCAREQAAVIWELLRVAGGYERLSRLAGSASVGSLVLMRGALL